MSDSHHWHLYILRLQENKWYVGITSRTPEVRFQEHKNKMLSARWTRRYNPIEIFYQKDLVITTKEKAELYENRVTRLYIEKYGLNNVRGGDLLDDEEYVARLGRVFTKNNWFTLTVVVLEMLVIVYLVIDKYTH